MKKWHSDCTKFGLPCQDALRRLKFDILAVEEERNSLGLHKMERQIIRVEILGFRGFIPCTGTSELFLPDSKKLRTSSRVKHIVTELEKRRKSQ
jgi:hypothetical protein